MENQKRILIVEDSPTVVEHIKIMLKNSNVKVFNAGSEFGMMQSIESYGKLVDLILMDLTLKTENGMDLIRNLRANDKYKKLPVIIITEHVSKDLILEARNLEVRGYLKKPIEKDIFLDRVYGVIGNVSIIPKKTDTGDDSPPISGSDNLDTNSESSPETGQVNETDPKTESETSQSPMTDTNEDKS
ncbi:response regulator [Fusibacter sp. JL216-2]|uniref:response regulator n=1 Tax=Fusibacter sp. JL216-2 TaxID=3071453 RepID=UPI003D357F9F